MKYFDGGGGGGDEATAATALDAIPTHELGTTETDSLHKILTSPSLHNPILALTLNGQCIAVLMAPSEYALLHQVELVAADPKRYFEVQRKGLSIANGLSSEDFVPSDVVFEGR